LVVLDIHYRQRAGEQPTAEEYHDRFPFLTFSLPDAVQPAESTPLLADLGTGRDPQHTGPDGQRTEVRSDQAPDRAAANLPAIPGYDSLALLGRGGMGVVYKARQRGLTRLVALKMILTGAHAGPQDLARFRREAEAVAHLSHPHIVQIHEIGDQAGLPYFSFEFVQGGSLAQKLAGTPLPARQAAQLLETLAAAVDAAHERGIIHRDLKPANVLLTADGTPKVTDFGLAKRLDAQAALTQSGAIVGTPSYMAPEQAEGKSKEIGPAADIYALGAVLYEVLTGRPPFKAATALETVLQVLNEEPVPPSRLVPKIPRDLETICLKAMAKVPARRYATSRALATDLRRFLKGEPIHARPVGRVERLWRWCQRKPAVAGLAASAALFLLAGTAFSSYFAIQARQQAQKADKKAAEALANARQADANAARTQQALEAEAKRRRQTRDALDMLSSQVIDDWLARQKELLPEHRSFLEKALASYEELARDTGQEEASRAGSAQAHLRVGKIRRRLGQMAEAQAAFVRSRELYEQLATDFPTVPGYRQDLAASHNNLGLILDATGRTQDAERAYRDALKLKQQLVTDFPSVPEYRQGLAGTYNNLGILLRHTGRPQDAERAHREAVKLREQLVTDFPTVPNYRQDLAASHNNLGILLAVIGRAQDAERAHRQALKLVEQLAKDFPSVPEYRQELAGTYNNLGILLRHTGRPQDAERAHREALKVKQQLVIDFPNAPGYRQELATSHINLGNLLAVTGQAQEAERALRDALKLQQQLAADFPGVPEYRRDLATSHNNLGILLRKIGRAQDAERAYRDALKLRQQLATDLPTVPDYRNELAGTMVNLAILLRLSKELGPARQLLEQAVPHHRAALQANPRNPLYREFFRNNRVGLAETLVELGEHAAAANTADQLIQAAVDPAGDFYDAACIFARCSSLAERDSALSELQRKEQVQAYADRAMTTLQQAVQKGYKNAAHMKKDGDLDPLRSRADFQKLLTELEARAHSEAK
jgi:serine/threonine-protein kinase